MDLYLKDNEFKYLRVQELEMLLVKFKSKVDFTILFLKMVIVIDFLILDLFHKEELNVV